jgi:alkylation response protein AidB-like acyl-CoA dehydrogenase
MIVIDELKIWLNIHWDPEMSLGDWWRVLGDSGWSQPDWPREWFGRGLSRAEGGEVTRTIRKFGALPGPPGFGTWMAGPVLLEHGSDAQKARFLPGIVYGTDAYCQLLSEPNAGSDLAGLLTRAVRDGESWIVNGQKVWTSAGQISNMAMLLARTNIDVPKHAGISYFLIDVDQPGVELRPLRELTGRSFFCEAFLTNAVAGEDNLIGGEGEGWGVVGTHLKCEREGREESPSIADPGPIAGNLDRQAGDFVVDETHHITEELPTSKRLMSVARVLERNDEPIVRDGLVQLYAMEQLISLTNQRAADLLAEGKELSGSGNLAKLGENRALRLGRDLTFSILGALGALHEYEGDEPIGGELPQEDEINELIEEALFAAAPQIYSGTDQIQHNIVAERVLGLPREPNVDKGIAFRDLLKN